MHRNPKTAKIKNEHRCEAGLRTTCDTKPPSRERQKTKSEFFIYSSLILMITYGGTQRPALNKHKNLPSGNYADKTRIKDPKKPNVEFLRAENVAVN